MSIFINVLLLVSVFSHSVSGDLKTLPYSTIRDVTADYILCRNCGSDIASSNYIVSRLSPVSRYAFNDTLYNRTDILIQVLSNNIFLNFPVITLTYSTCIDIGEWEEDNSWFPGYLWKPCICPECGAHVGWVFQPTSPDLISSSKSFYGLILTSLVGESFTNSLTKFPASGL